MVESLKFNPGQLSYQAMLGTGGIGSGTFFLLNGNHTLGREESRSGHFLDNRDYCKLHIIAHYVKTLLGEAFPVIPIGKVGKDEQGIRLLDEMKTAGLDTSHVTLCEKAGTLTSICYLYPDGSGGNLTVDHSACDEVDQRTVDSAENTFEKYRGKGIALAAPEVPLVTRKYLLEQAAKFSFLRVASFTTGEMDYVNENQMLSLIDLLAVNLEEGAAMAKLHTEDIPAEETARQVIAYARRTNPRINLTVTAGSKGSWVWDGVQVDHVAAITVPASSAAGAGDAYLSGMIISTALGLPLLVGARLAALIAAVSVTSPHTIHPTLDRRLLQATSKELSITLPGIVQQLLAD